MNKELLQDLNAVYNGLNEDLDESKILLGNIIDKLEKAINYTRCSIQLKDKESMSFNDWVESEGYEEKFTGFWKDGKSQDYWTMKDRYNVYRDNL